MVRDNSFLQRLVLFRLKATVVISTARSHRCPIRSPFISSFFEHEATRSISTGPWIVHRRVTPGINSPVQIYTPGRRGAL